MAIMRRSLNNVSQKVTEEIERYKAMFESLNIPGEDWSVTGWGSEFKHIDRALLVHLARSFRPISDTINNLTVKIKERIKM